MHLLHQPLHVVGNRNRLIPAVCQQLRTMPGVQEFIARYPGGTPSSAAVYSGFPLWLRLLHFFNFFLMMFIIRAGIQILAERALVCCYCR